MCDTLIKYKMYGVSAITNHIAAIKQLAQSVIVIVIASDASGAAPRDWWKHLQWVFRIGLVLIDVDALYQQQQQHELNEMNQFVVLAQPGSDCADISSSDHSITDEIFTLSRLRQRHWLQICACVLWLSTLMPKIVPSCSATGSIAQQLMFFCNKISWEFSQLGKAHQWLE